MSGWTTVRYGRRRRAYGAGRGQGTEWGMDRAPPRPYGGRVPNPFSNRPVPPSSRFYRGPQSRSYAEVTRSRRNGRRKGFNSPAPRGQDFQRDQRQPTDPGFAKLVRQLHAVIKTVHHLQNVTPKDGDSGPRMISRMVDTLSDMIKPAFPTINTTDLIVGNAKNWGYNTLLILEEHYKEGLEGILEELSRDLDSGWKTAFQVATKWAYKNMPRITREVIEHAEALIAACSDQEREEDNGEPTAPMSQGAQRAQTTPRTQGRRSSHASQQTTTADNTTQPQSEHITHTQASMVDAAQQTTTNQSVATMTDHISDWSPVVREEEEHGDHGTSPAPPLSTPRGQSSRQPPRKRIRIPGVVFEEDFDLQIEEIEDSGEPRVSRRVVGAPTTSHADPRQGQNATPAATVHSLAQGGQTVAQILPQAPNRSGFQGDSPPRDWDARGDDSLVGLSASPAPQRSKVTKHIVSNRKMIDWTLSVTRKWLIIGDSNLARIPPFSIPDLQVDSYPGANFRHAQAVIAKSTSHVVVEKVVLSIGLNSRTQRAKETAVKQMQAAVRTAKGRFPYAEIWIPVVNFSSALPHVERASLYILNDHIKKNLPFIPQLSNRLFHTENDNIHWTRDTARSMFDHWVSYLNLKAL